MKKIFLPTFLILLSIMTMGLTSNFNVYAQNSHPNTPPPKDGLIISLLYPHIADAIVQEYGTGKLFQNERVLCVEKDPDGSNIFKVKVFFQTFTGPHNPPYGNDTLTFTVSATGVTLNQYEHMEQP